MLKQSINPRTDQVIEKRTYALHYTLRNPKRIRKSCKSFTATACKVQGDLAYKNPHHQTIFLTPSATSAIVYRFQLFTTLLRFIKCMPICSFPMANTIFSSNHHHQSMKALHVVGLLCLLLLVHKGDATQFTVGGSKGWTLPAPEVHYNQWAENNRFQIGDSLGKTIEIFFPGKSLFLQFSIYIQLKLASKMPKTPSSSSSFLG
jgi:hypothetical protein